VIERYAPVSVDQSVPTGGEWHRDLLQQMGVALPGVRPQVLSARVVRAIDEYLRFRHVVRDIYTFEFDPERIERLVQNLRPIFEQTRLDLLAFADFLEQLAREG
jgi:hypothetical protein